MANLKLVNGKYYGFDTINGKLYDLDTLEYIDEVKETKSVEKEEIVVENDIVDEKPEENKKKKSK